MAGRSSACHLTKRGLCGALDGIARHEGHARGRGAARIAHGGRVGGDHADLLEWYAKRLRCELRHDSMRALPDLRPGVPDNDMFHLGLAMDLDARPGIFLVAE